MLLFFGSACLANGNSSDDGEGWEQHHRRGTMLWDERREGAEPAIHLSEQLTTTQQ
jgi:hypothetical protein